MKSTNSEQLACLHRVIEVLFLIIFLLLLAMLVNLLRIG